MCLQDRAGQDHITGNNVGIVPSFVARSIDSAITTVIPVEVFKVPVHSAVMLSAQAKREYGRVSVEICAGAAPATVNVEVPSKRPLGPEKLGKVEDTARDVSQETCLGPTALFWCGEAPGAVIFRSGGCFRHRLRGLQGMAGNAARLFAPESSKTEA